MPLPIILPPGVVAIYGVGLTGTSPSGITLEPSYRYGTIYNVWDGGATYIYGNDTVIFKEGDQYARVVTVSDGLTYTLIQARLVTKDIVAP